ncbi:MAG: hypothetical protein OXH56_02585 [Gemmatimonadetes bacterium]|nr:hypothetical protein [Gemmatimonadota bacterium]
MIPLCLFWLAGCAGQESEPETADTVPDRAQVIADEVMEAMGGRDNWDATRYIRFSFFGFRTHYWDKHDGRYRVSWTDRESGQSHVILMNLNTGEGSAFVDGSEVTDVEERERSLERARGAWINDTYWLLMPYKLRDPGVDLAYDGEEVVDGTVYDKLHLSFNEVGNTPGDEYWAYINRETRLMDKWVYLLQLREGQDERSRGEWKWNDWRRHGDILLSAERERMDGQKRSHEDLAVLEFVDDQVFTSPDPVSPEMVGEQSTQPATTQPAEGSE